MAEYLSGGIYFSGIGNGTNFSEIVDKLKEVESIPQKRLESWKSDWKVRFDAFTEVINSMREAQTKLAGINNPQKFITKKATSSKSDILSATANAKAIDGNHTIDVKQMASNSIWAFNGSYAGKNSSVNTSGTTQKFSYSYKDPASKTIPPKEITRELDIPPGTTLESLANMINKDGDNPGVRMNIIKNGEGYSFQIAGKDTGADARLTIHPNNLDGMSGGTSTWTSSIGDPTAPFTPPGGTVKYTVNKGGTTHEFNIPASGNLNDLVNEINTTMGAGTAQILTRDGKDTLVLADGVTAEGRGLNGKVVNTEKSVYVIPSSAQQIDVDNPTADYNYSYKDKDGNTYAVTLKGSDTMEDIVNKFNSVPVDKRPPDWPADGKVAKITTKDGQTRIELAEGFTGLAGKDIPAVTKEVIRSEWSSEVEPTRPLDSARFSLVDGDGTTHTFDLPGSSNLSDLAAAINTKLGAGKATIKEEPAGSGKYQLDMKNIRSLTGEGLNGKVDSFDKWSIQEAKNAIFKVDNWPKDVESASNTVKDVIEGVEFTIMGHGKAQITIQSDSSSVKKNIQEYLDAVNSVVKVMQDLSKVDEVNNTNGETYTNKSQFAKASGSALTGNYGTQLLNSRMKSLTSGVPPGFTRIEGTDVLSGDMVASLAQMGIKTCTQEGDPNYGLFMIAPPSTSKEMQALDQEKFDKYLKDNLDDVVNLFAADEIARSNSANFHYTSHIKGMAKPGNYDVSYSVNADGTMGDVFINGAKAKPGGNGLYTADDAAGNAKSLSIQIDNTTPGLNFSGTISIQQGKVSEMETFLASELRYNEKDPKGNGSIMILQANYKGIMTNIDKKIEKEEERLMKWERNKRLEFSRLETLLGQYERNMTSMQSQLSGLTSSA